jgi:hypothetical protein
VIFANFLSAVWRSYTAEKDARIHANLVAAKRQVRPTIWASMPNPAMQGAMIRGT